MLVAGLAALEAASGPDGGGDGVAGTLWLGDDSESRALFRALWTLSAERLPAPGGWSDGRTAAACRLGIRSRDGGVPLAALLAGPRAAWVAPCLRALFHPEISLSRASHVEALACHYPRLVDLTAGFGGDDPDADGVAPLAASRSDIETPAGAPRDGGDASGSTAEATPPSFGHAAAAAVDDRSSSPSSEDTDWEPPAQGEPEGESGGGSETESSSCSSSSDSSDADSGERRVGHWRRALDAAADATSDDDEGDSGSEPAGVGGGPTPPRSAALSPSGQAGQTGRGVKRSRDGADPTPEPPAVEPPPLGFALGGPPTPSPAFPEPPSLPPLPAVLSAALSALAPRLTRLRVVVRHPPPTGGHLSAEAGWVNRADGAAATPWRRRAMAAVRDGPPRPPSSLPAALALVVDRARGGLLALEVDGRVGGLGCPPWLVAACLGAVGGGSCGARAAAAGLPPPPEDPPRPPGREPNARGIRRLLLHFGPLWLGPRLRNGADANPLTWPPPHARRLVEAGLSWAGRGLGPSLLSLDLVLPPAPPGSTLEVAAGGSSFLRPLGWLRDLSLCPLSLSMGLADGGGGDDDGLALRHLTSAKVDAALVAAAAAERALPWGALSVHDGWIRGGPPLDRALGASAAARAALAGIAGLARGGLLSLRVRARVTDLPIEALTAGVDSLVGLRDLYLELECLGAREEADVDAVAASARVAFDAASAAGEDNDDALLLPDTIPGPRAVALAVAPRWDHQCPGTTTLTWWSAAQAAALRARSDAGSDAALLPATWREAEAVINADLAALPRMCPRLAQLGVTIITRRRSGPSSASVSASVARAAGGMSRLEGLSLDGVRLFGGDKTEDRATLADILRGTKDVGEGGGGGCGPRLRRLRLSELRLADLALPPLPEPEPVSVVAAAAATLAPPPRTPAGADLLARLPRLETLDIGADEACPRLRADDEDPARAAARWAEVEAEAGLLAAVMAAAARPGSRLGRLRIEAPLRCGYAWAPAHAPAPAGRGWAPAPGWWAAGGVGGAGDAGGPLGPGGLAAVVTAAGGRGASPLGGLISLALCLPSGGVGPGHARLLASLLLRPFSPPVDDVDDQVAPGSAADISICDLEVEAGAWSGAALYPQADWSGPRSERRAAAVERRGIERSRARRTLTRLRNRGCLVRVDTAEEGLLPPDGGGGRGWAS